MSTTLTRASSRTSRRQSFVVSLLVLLYIAQPALALVGVSCSDHNCGSVAEHCCCESPAELPVQPVPEDSCCSDELSEPLAADRPSAEEDCSCRVDSTPVPAPDPALPLGGSESTGDSLRTHAEIFSHTPSGPPWMHLPPGPDDRAAGPVPLPRAGDFFASRPLRASTWALLRRGVSGLLAVLSVARL